MYDRCIMKLTSALLLLATPLAAQTATTPHPAAKPATTAAKPAVAACAKLPTISDKIPALAAGLTCAKHLYTLTTIPTVKISDISPLEGPGLKEDLGIEPSSFSLDYIDTKVGTGQLAGAHSWYSINYTGYLVDGTKFDSSIDRGEPITIPYGQHQVIPGWDTGFAGMRVGGKRRLFIPYQLAYGAQGKGPIPAKAELIFDVELVKISETPPPAKPAPAPPTAPKPGTPGSAPGAPGGAQPAPTAPPPGSPTKPTPPPADPSKPATVPPPTDPTKPAAVPPASTTPKL